MNLTPRTQHGNESTRDNPAAQILSDGQARGLMRAMIESRQWWTLPISNETGVELAAEIERRYYAGEADRDFLIVLGPLPAVFARKQQMPAAALAKLLAEVCTKVGWSEAQWRSAVAEQDILMGIPGDAEEEEAVSMLHLWRAWLMVRS